MFFEKLNIAWIHYQSNDWNVNPHNLERESAVEQEVYDKELQNDPLEIR